MVISIRASHLFLHLFFGQNLHCVLGEEITKARPDGCNNHGVSIFRGQLRSGSGHQNSKVGTWSQLGRRESLAEGPRQRFRRVQGDRVKNRGDSGPSGEGA
jgi:hypothetical protein